MNTNDYNKRDGWYRSRNGVFMGVCRGLAEHFDFPVFGMRVLWILVALVTVFWPVVIVYLIAGVLMKPEPVVPFQTAEDREFYDSAACSRAAAVARLKRTYDSLDHRLQRMEAIVTSPDFQWERRLRDGE
ncbi:TPA: envelope stress response membrane protein PspC [Candidatus Sumerlaeota bacterium]|jgi:phage shock protein C|nr:envelope stress response membrane protein PspC [Candidatus Sumerlaeota bacterium]